MLHLVKGATSLPFLSPSLALSLPLNFSYAHTLGRLLNVLMRRSTRAVKSKPNLREASEGTSSDGENSVDSSQDDHDTSEDEWRPEDGQKKKRKGRRGAVEEESDDDDIDDDEEEETSMIGDEEIVEFDPRHNRSKRRKLVKLVSSRDRPPKTTAEQAPIRPKVATDEDILAAQAAFAADEAEEAEEREAERRNVGTSARAQEAEGEWRE
jgi:hypothetical protein